MAHGKIGSIGGVDGASGVKGTMNIMRDLMKLVADLAQQDNAPPPSGMRGLQSGVANHQKAAADQVRPPDDSDDADGIDGPAGASGPGQSDPMQGLMQMMMQLLQMMMRLMQQMNGGGSPSPSPDAGNVAGRIGSGSRSPLGLGGGHGGSSATGGAGHGHSAPPATLGESDAPGKLPSATPATASGASSAGGAGSFSTAAQVGPLSAADSKKMAVDTTARLQKDFNLSKEQAAGIVGNLYHESAGMNANVNEFGSVPPGQEYGKASASGAGGYGWAQWTGSRKTDYLNFCKSQGLDPASPEANYQMLKHELQGSESATIGAVKKTSTAQDASTAFRSVYERAANPVDPKRIADAKMIAAAMG